jgi:exodeoxyribonuclease V alpha subunit
MITLNQQQQAAVKMVQKNHVSILTGGPGTGKTTTCKEILAWADNQGMRVACCAPSGKAAKRIQEQTEFSASTIHKLLEAEIQGDFFFFNRHDQNHIDCDMLVVDETSMVDTSLMACLLKATAPETKVLFVGDAGQLPSVQAGAVLRDMVASGVIPHTELTDIHRNSGDIVKACHKIRYGELFDPSERLDPDSGLNIRHIECSSPARIKDIVVDLAVNRLPARGYDPQTDIQVLCATNEKTEISCAALNAALRAKLNPNAAGADEISGLITGDKIINTKIYSPLQERNSRVCQSARNVCM